MKIETSLAIGLYDPKFAHNVGGALRAASCYGATHLLWAGDRIDEALAAKQRLPREERMKGYRDVIWRREDSFLSYFARHVTPVAVEMCRGAEELPLFVHP